MKGYRLVSVTIIIFVLSISSLVGAERVGWHASGKGGAVASTGRDAVPAGIGILEQGGNAADAASAMLLALSITEYGVYTIGAEVPLIIYDAKKEEVKVLSGQGAPLAPKAMEWYYENGIPSSGSIKASPVPGAMGLCIDLVKLYGTMRFEEVAAPTLEMLDDGDEEWQKNLAVTFRKLIETERDTEGSREEKLQAARDRFYKGDIADALEAFYIREGGFLRKKDLAAHVTRIEDPVTVEYKGYTVCKCPTWTQGPYLCQALKLLEGFDLKKMGRSSADYFHVLTEALKLALADRDEYYGDPLFADVPMEALLSDVYNQIRRPLIDMSKASAEVRPGDPINMKAVKGPGEYRPGPGGTTTCVVADKWGNMVSATPSGNSPYTVCEELGIAHGNRLRSLNTTPGHPNRIEPGKRPRITLTPTLVLKDGKPVAAKAKIAADEKRARNSRASTDWMVKAKYGVMFHWEPNSQPRHGPKKPYAEAVRDFDVNAFADMVEKTGGGYVIFTLNHGHSQWPAPIKSWEKIHPGWTTERDLVGDMADVLDKRGIKMMLYIASHCVVDDALSCDSISSGEEAVEVHIETLQEMGLRYGRKLAGYWFDGWDIIPQHSPSSATPFERVFNACKAGNPERIISANYWLFPDATGWQEYWAGEIDGPLKPATGRYIEYSAGEGLQLHTLIMLEGIWVHGRPDSEMESPVFTEQELIDFVRDITGKQGVVTINLGIFQDGTIGQKSAKVMRTLREAIKN
ncbi:gamma-glutamyltransferase [Planctomycetota bacterium]